MEILQAQVLALKEDPPPADAPKNPSGVFRGASCQEDSVRFSQANLSYLYLLRLFLVKYSYL